MPHPRQTIRDNIETVLNDVFSPLSIPVITGGQYANEEKNLPNVLFYMGDESQTVLNQVRNLNAYSRGMTLYVVLKTKNKDRETAIIDCENNARLVEDALCNPNSSILNDTITTIVYNSYQVSEPKEGSTVFATQLTFTINYTDSF